MLCCICKEKPATVHLTPRRKVAELRRELSAREGEAVLGTPADAVALVSLVGALLQARAANLAERQAHAWQVAFDSLDDGMCVIDMAGRLSQCNWAMAEFVGNLRGATDSERR